MFFPLRGTGICMSNEEVYERFMKGIGFPVRSKKMFGGLGIFSDTTMFALVYDGVAYLKSTEELAGRYVDDGFQFVPPFGRRAAMPYWNVPEGLFGSWVLHEWAGKALEYALATKKKKPKK